MDLATRLKRKGIGNYFVVGLMLMVISFIAEMIVTFLFILPATGAVLIGSYELGLVLAGLGLVASIPALGYVAVKLGGN